MSKAVRDPLIMETTMIPTTTRLAGFDLNGNPVELGQFDSDGYYVGFIDEDNLAHESHFEAEKSRACGTFTSLFQAWRVGRGPLPDPDEILEAVSPWQRRRIRDELFKDILFWMEITEAQAGRDGHFPLPVVLDRAAGWSM